MSNFAYNRLQIGLRNSKSAKNLSYNITYFSKTFVFTYAQQQIIDSVNETQ